MPFSTDLGFVRSRLLRHSAERDQAALDEARRAPEAATVLIAGEVPILMAEGEGATALLPVADLDRLPAVEEQAFLGTVEGRPVLASLAGAPAADLYRDDPRFRVVDLRTVAVTGVVSGEELGLLATAKALLHWHATHRFCPRCGGPTTAAAAGFRRDCEGCRAQHFPRTDPVAIMLVARGDRCLLGRQARFPPGVYSCLAGFIEPGETLEDAVRRETFEEAGVTVGEVAYLASQPWPFPSSLMIGCLGEATSDALTLDREELEDGRWFTREEVGLMLERRHPDGLVTPPPMAIAHHLLRRWMESAA